MVAPKRGHLGGVLKTRLRRSDDGGGPTFPNRGDYVSSHSYNELSDAGRRVYESRVQSDLDKNPWLTPMVIPGRIIQNVHAAVYDFLGGKRAVDTTPKPATPGPKRVQNIKGPQNTRYKPK